MKKGVLLLALSATLFLLTGCFDAFQTISIDGGTITTSVRFSVQKMIFEMIGEITGEPFEFTEFFGEAEAVIFSGFGTSVRLDSFESEVDAGMYFDLSTSMKEMSRFIGDNPTFIPVYRQGELTVRLPMIGGADDNEFAIALLSSAKYRLVVQCTDELVHLSDVSVSYEPVYQGIQFDMESKAWLSVHRSGSLLVIEVPFLILMTEDEGNVVLTIT